nr:hypothetical protein BaRGS_030303 [Batillaria attramentaria]
MDTAEVYIPWCLTANETSVLTAHSRKPVSDLSIAVIARGQDGAVSIQQASRDRRVALIPVTDDINSCLLISEMCCLTFGIQGTGETLEIEEEDIRRVLQHTNPHKAAGPDRVKPKVLKICADQLASILTIIFNMS